MQPTHCRFNEVKPGYVGSASETHGGKKIQSTTDLNNLTLLKEQCSGLHSYIRNAPEYIAFCC